MVKAFSDNIQQNKHTNERLHLVTAQMKDTTTIYKFDLNDT